MKFHILADAIRKHGGIALGKCGGPDNDIASVHYHAQNVVPGGMFVAIPGLKADGHDFIETAIARGACAIAGERLPPLHEGVSHIETDNSRKALAILSSRFYQNPSEHLHVIAITGTNGKTTTSYLIESILACAGLNTGVIGTINYRYGGKSFRNPVTTPESLDLQNIMANMRDNGVTHLVMEASSHALDLHRLCGCAVNVGVFTNFTRDHLDYHLTMESYRNCKRKLFQEHLLSDGTAVINCDDPEGMELSRMLSVRVITLGNSSDNMIRSKNLRHDLRGIRGTIVTPKGEFDFASQLIGMHNLENILCAVGAGIASDLPLDAMSRGIEALASVPGRLEPVINDVERFVYVDYAHTPDALENVLSCLKKLAGQRLICVFGCGGDRDRGKRPLMGEIAAKYADMIVVTSDNPRSEPPMSIIEEILPGISKLCPNEYIAEELLMGFEAGGYVIEPDRGKAIKLAVSVSRPDDVILIAGKGHENYQIIGDKTLPFDDKEEATKALSDY